MRLKNLIVFICVSILILSCEKQHTLEQIQENLKGKIITKKQAIQLSKNYDARAKLIDTLIGKPDARSAWFSMSDLENYIQYAKKQDPSTTGIRIYFGAYGDAVKGKEKYSTVFLVPTKPAKTMGNSFFYFKDDDDSNVPPLNTGDLGNPPQATYPTP